MLRLALTLAAHALNLASLAAGLNWLIALFWGELVISGDAKIGGRPYSSPAMILFLIIMAQLVLNWLTPQKRPLPFALRLINQAPVWADRLYFRLESLLGKVNTQALSSIFGLWLPLKLTALIIIYALQGLLMKPMGVLHGDGACYDYLGWDFWLKWDSNHYICIAKLAYSTFEQHAFFPLYPVAISLFSALTTLPLHISAIWVSNLSACLAIWVIYRTYYESLGGQALRAFVLLWAVWPGSFYFSTAYSESLYALLLALSLQGFRQDSLARYGLFGALCTMCRPSGVLLLPVTLAARLISQPKLKAGLILLCAPLLGLLAYAAYCYWDTGDPLAFSKAQEAWGRRPGIALAVMAELFRSLGSNPEVWSLNQMRAMIDAGMIILSLSVCGFLWKRVGIAEALLVLFTLILCLSTGSTVSLTRIMLSAYPIFLALGLLLQNRQKLLIVLSLGLFGLNLAGGLLYSLHVFVW